MRSSSRRARGASSALALSVAIAVVVPSPLALADDRRKPSRRTVAECTAFEQTDRETEDGVDFSIRNACSMPVTCSLSWAVTCAPESKKRRSRKVDSHDFQLDADAAITLTASTARCGDDGWAIDGISWSCAPARD
jgi:hypothetical protein